MVFDNIEAPVAHSMVDHLNAMAVPPDTPFTKFSCCWMAFNNIYFLVSKQKADQEAAGGGKVRTKPPAEWEQHEFILKEFTPQLKNELINSPAFQFFLNRRPRWGGSDVMVDDNGNRANGVTNLAKSAYKGRPVLATIDEARYRRWLTAARTPQDTDGLVAQIVDMIYTVRNNTFHGRKELLDPVARAVIDNAYELLRMIVVSFLT